MTVADDMIALLKDEDTVLKARRFAELPELQRRKEELMVALEEGVDGATLERIRRMARENEQMMGTALTAIRGLKARFERMGDDTEAVGYAQDGSKMAVGGINSNRRV